MQSYVFTSDDRELGLAFHERPSAESLASRLQVTAEDEQRVQRCGAYALAIYGKPIPAAAFNPFQGWASPAEKTFYQACIEGASSTDEAD
jgi:hypothetical protein